MNFQVARVPGKRRRRRQKTGGKEPCKRDMERVGLNMKEVLDKT